MIIGISGAQGQGKTTLINTVKNNQSIETRNLQTAREVLKEWDYTLTEINSYLPLKIKFQEELYNRHYNALRQLHLESPSVFLVERTFADIFSYALLSIGPFNQYSDWLNEYAEKCEQAQNSLFNYVIFLSGRGYIPEDDGVRSVNQHFSDMADYLIKKYTFDFTKNGNGNGNCLELNEPDLNERVNILNNIIKKLEMTGGAA